MIFLKMIVNYETLSWYKFLIDTHNFPAGKFSSLGLRTSEMSIKTTPQDEFRNSRKIRKNTGVSLIEVIIGTSIILIAFVSLVTTYNFFLKTALKNTEQIQSAYLLEEGLEAIRSVRDSSWDENITPLSQGVSYGLTFDGSKWVVNYSPLMIDNKFYRELAVDDVYRDVNDDIASSGTLDSNTKFFTVNVSFIKDGATTTKSISGYLSKIF